MAYEIQLDKNAQKQIDKLVKNQKLLAKILLIFEELEVDPYSKTHKFERLKYNLSGFCSKRIDQKNRIVYQVIDEKVLVFVVSVIGHYE
jgi:toxin YoeB